MSFEQLVHYLIENYGYLTILIWTFIEGETVVILAGMAVAAGIGKLELFWVIVYAITGSVSGDQLYYYMGRRWGPRLIDKRPSWRERAEVVYTHLRRHQYWLILTFRFYYGIRNVTPFAIGAAHIPRLRFFLLNLIGGVVWAICFAGGGYLLGETFERYIGDYRRYVLYIFGVLILIGFSAWLYTVMRYRRRAQERLK